MEYRDLFVLRDAHFFSETKNEKQLFEINLIHSWIKSVQHDEMFA